MNVDSILRENEGLIRSTTARITSKFSKTKHSATDFDDFLSEARIAAWKAIRTHHRNGKAKLSTYMVRCMTNRLIDIDRSARKKSAPPLMVVDNIEGPSLMDLNTHVDKEQRAAGFKPCDPNHIRPVVSLTTYLNRYEADIIRKIKVGYKLHEIVTERSKKRSISKRQASCEVVKCLHRIRQKLTLEDVSHEAMAV